MSKLVADDLLQTPHIHTFNAHTPSLLLLSRGKRPARVARTTKHKRNNGKGKGHIRPHNRIIHGRILARHPTPQRNHIHVVARPEPRARTPSKRAQTHVRPHFILIVPIQPRKEIIRRPRNQMQRPRLTAVRMTFPSTQTLAQLVNKSFTTNLTASDQWNLP